jgi:hypothetical protein
MSLTLEYFPKFDRSINSDSWFIDNRIDNSLSCRQKKHEIGTTEDKE